MNNFAVIGASCMIAIMLWCGFAPIWFGGRVVVLGIAVLVMVALLFA